MNASSILRRHTDCHRPGTVGVGAKPARQRRCLVTVVAVGLCMLSAVASAGAEEGIAAFKTGDYDKAFEELKPAAEAGDPEAAYYLGSLLYRGASVSKDRKAARRWFDKGASAGGPDAQASLAYMYSNGIAGEHNEKKAAKWYLKAAKQGHVSAQRNMGLMYKEGEGVKYDEDEAARWFRRSAEQGDSVAQTELGHAYWMGYGLDKDKRKALDWLRRAAKQDEAKAQYLLCADLTDLYPQHSPHLVRAMMWCKLSADQGYSGGEGMWDASHWFVNEHQKQQAAQMAREWREEQSQ